MSEGRRGGRDTGRFGGGGGGGFGGGGRGGGMRSGWVGGPGGGGRKDDGRLESNLNQIIPNRIGGLFFGSFWGEVHEAALDLIKPIQRIWAGNCNYLEVELVGRGHYRSLEKFFTWKKALLNPFLFEIKRSQNLAK